MVLPGEWVAVLVSCDNIEPCKEVVDVWSNDTRFLGWILAEGYCVELRCPWCCL